MKIRLRAADKARPDPVNALLQQIGHEWPPRSQPEGIEILSKLIFHRTALTSG